MSQVLQRQFKDIDYELSSRIDARSFLAQQPLGVFESSSEQGRPLLTLRVAETQEDYNSAAALVNRRFGWRGYGNDHKLPTNGTHTTFIAIQNDMVIGTITLSVDDQHDLALDNEFRSEIDSFRSAPGAKVCELTKFAFEADVPDQHNLAILFHTVFLYGFNAHECTDLFIGVNPRHRRFYQAMLGFMPIGDLKTNSVVNAPAQLMWLNVSEIRASIERHREGARSRSLYSLFLSPSEEQMVLSNLNLPLRSLAHNTATPFSNSGI